MIRRLFLTGILLVGLLSSLIEGGTLGFFSSAQSSAGNQFVTGSVTLAAGIAGGDTLSVNDLVPGDSFVAGLAMENDGTLPLWYSMSATVSGVTFGSALQLTVRTKTANPCSSLDGTVLYGPGSLSAAAFGQPAVGQQAGDRYLAAAAGETLCFQVQLPAGASPTLAGTDATATFTFLATQE